MGELDTVYIVSKGRPQCRTAQTLTKMGYPGKWFVVCGTNDETLPEYRARWGEHVLTFDWYEQVKHADVLDNFGFEHMASGAVPVRNATRAISEARGERRHWQLDDDYTGFQITDVANHSRPTVKDGAELYRWMHEIAEFADRCGLANCGFPPATLETSTDNWWTFGRRVFNAHNLPSDPELFTEWRGRMNDDLINAMWTYQHGGAELSFKFISMNMPPTQEEKGGLTELYRAEGTVRKTAYAVLIAPNAVRLVKRFGRYHHKVNWDRVCPKMVSDEWQRK